MKQGCYEAGHYYSPIPSRETVVSEVPAIDRTIHVSNIDFRDNEQRELLKSYSVYLDNFVYSDHAVPERRYYAKNDWFNLADAFFLYSFVRKYQPNRIIEIGSGYSSALVLDTLDQHPELDIDLTFIEPNPERLNKLLRPEDRKKATIYEQEVQKLDLAMFEALEPGDLLFIDSSHVMKFGSDVEHIIFEILPILPEGVYVHFHDIFYPFEYPELWLYQGRYWNECYFLRAFLAGNSAWQIMLFDHYATLRNKDLMAEHLPLCSEEPSCSLYLKKTSG